MPHFQNGHHTFESNGHHTFESNGHHAFGSNGHFRTNRAFEPETPYNMHNAIASWFLGPQAENKERLKDLFTNVVQQQAEARKAYHPEDGAFITDSMIASSEFQENVDKLETEFYRLSGLLNKFSVPFFSPRYAGHMCFETSMPAILGWILTILYNPNNVAFEASPITTLLEIDVGRQMCEMLGYYAPTKPEPEKTMSWGHIACDGTIANMESMWSARNLKFYPLSLRAAMEKGQVLDFCASTLKVYTCGNTTEKVLFSDLKSWDLVNLPVDVILNLPEDLHDQCGVSQDFLGKALKPFLVQEQGKDGLLKKYSVKEPQYLISATRHYSWPKSAALTGIGAENVVNIPVDKQARMSIDRLRDELQKHLDEEQPVYAVVAVIGTTEEGAVDPLDKVIELRDEFKEKGLSFVVHADAAWGGYFASMIRDPEPVMSMPRDGDRDHVFEFSLRKSTVDQFHALKNTDSITLDPHKAGYVPYPAGGLCYRDGRMRYLVTWSAPYLDQGNTSGSIGVYGIEGSKPGAPAAAVYLHHSVVGLHRRGHGALLGEAIWTSSRLSAHWATLSDDKTDFIMKPFNPCDDPKDLETIRTRIIGKDNVTVHNDKEACRVLRELGSDLNINAFCLNFRINGKVNEDVEEANFLNNAVYRALSIVDQAVEVAKLPMFLSATTFEMETYGECCTHYKERLGLETESKQDLFVLRNVVMSPFQSAGDFVSQIAGILRGIVEEKTKMVIERNTIKPSQVGFIVQGKTDKVHLVLVPQFHNANYRTQLILRADILQEEPGRSDSDMPQILLVNDTTVERIINAKTLDGILIDGFTRKAPRQVTIGNIQVVKNRTLQSAYRDHDYPQKMPFYLYGQGDEVFVDHMLLRAPNVQITATEPISLGNLALTDEQLAKGVLAFIDVNERAGQPFSEHDFTHIFTTEREFAVRIYDDEHPAYAQGPGLANTQSSPIASGTLKFAAWPWVWDGINQHSEPPSVSDGMQHKSLQDLLDEIPVILPQSHSNNGKSSVSKHHMYSLKMGPRSGFAIPNKRTAKTVGAWVDVMTDTLPSFRK